LVYSKNFTHDKLKAATSWLMKNNGTYRCTINSDTHEIVKLTPKTTIDDDNIFIWLLMLIILIVCPMGFLLFIYISREDRKIHGYDLLYPELIPDFDNNSPWHK
jgi:hypothetical protein